MGVPPEKVPDVMALMGDSIDNIPGAKGIGEKGARELIRRASASVEAALEHAARSRRQTLSRSPAERPRTSHAVEAARDHLPPTLPSRSTLSPDTPRTRFCMRCAIFTSSWASLRCCAICPLPRPSQPSPPIMPRSIRPHALRRFLAAQPAGPRNRRVAHVDAGERESEGFGARVTGFELSPEPGVARSAWCDEK